MTQLIRLGSHLNIAQSEADLHEIVADPGRDIRIPTNLTGHQLGGVAALIQLLITWGKGNPQGRLATYIPNSDKAKEQLENFVTLDHGLVAVLRAADVLMQNGDSCRAEANEFARTRIEQMEGGPDEARRGPKVFLLCADHTSKAFLPPFYFQTANKEVRAVGDFQRLARQLLKKTWGFHPSSEPVPVEVSNQLGIILHELFENTHNWARTECNGRRVQRSLRGVRFELHRNTIEELRKSATDAAPLTAYLSRQNFQREDQRPLRIVEISVFDSGPGLAQRMIGRCIDATDRVDTEKEAVLQCFALHSTTSQDTHRGLGLHTVLAMLGNRNGFLRLRTGRLNLYRDFLQEPFEPREPDTAPLLLDWQTETERAVECPRTEGTLLSMFIPVQFG